MKTRSSLWASAVLALVALATFQVHPLTHAAPGPGLAPAKAPSPLNDVRFDFEYPDVPLADVIRDVQQIFHKETGVHLNVVIPTAFRRLATEELIHLQLKQVTIREFFELLAIASKRPAAAGPPTVDPVTGAVLSPPPGEAFISYRFVEVSAGDSSNIAWALESDAPPEAFLKDMVEPAPPVDSQVQYFSLVPYLEAHAVEDIVSAIREGWKMQGIQSVPRLMFHEKTQLLVAVGSARDLQAVRQVLQELRPPGSVPRRSPTVQAPQ